MKTLGKMLGGLVVLAVAVIVAGIAVLKSMDFDTYRGVIADQVKAATGRELTIAGALKVEVSLNPALAVEGVTFANAPWGSRRDMIVLKRLAAEVQLLPLLRGEVRVNRLVLSGLDALFEIDGQGRANWDIAPSGPSAARPGGEGRPLPVFDKVDVRDARIAYRDARDGTAVNLAIEAFVLEGRDAESPIAVAVKAVHDGRAVSAKGQLGALKTLMEANVRYPVRLEIDAPGVKAAVDGHVVNPRAPKEFDFKTTVAADSVAAVLPPAHAAKVPAVGPLKAAFRIKGQGRAYAIENLDAGVGRSDLSGSARISLAAPIADITAVLRSRRVDLKEWRPPGTKAERTPAKDGRMFSADPLPLESLRLVNLDIRQKINEAVLPNGVTVREVDARATIRDGRLAFPLELTAAGGRIKGETTIDAAPVPARIAARFGGDNVDWGRLLADLGFAEMVWDSKAEAAVDLRAAGNSVRALMAGLEGDARVVLGPGRIGNKYIDLAGGDAVTQVLNAFNPFAKSDEFTELKCAVARFKVTGGVAEARDGIAIETGKMTVAGGGRADLGAETLNFTFKPEAREGLGIGLGNLVGQVRIGGTFAEPTYGFDPLAAVTGTVGAVTGAVTGAVSGGLSTITGVLTGERPKTGPSPCQVALGLAPRPQPQPAPAQPAAPPPKPPEQKKENLGDAVRGIGEGISRGLKGILGR